MSTPLTTLDGPAGRRWFEHALRSLLLVRADVDELNVFPVPDSDTGTNLVMTLAAAAEATRELPADADLGALVGRAADGALLGARGSSGVILSQALQAIALELAGRGSMDGRALAAALVSAASGARSAVSRPVEGTILTVAAAAADGARDVVDAHGADAADGSSETPGRPPLRGEADAVGRAPLLEVVQGAVERARTALAGTDGAHGGASVDAGAAGYMVVLDALADVVRGAAPTSTRSDALRRALAVGVHGAGPGRTGPADGAEAEEHGAGEFEVMYVLRADGAQAAELRERLCRVGCAVAVVGQATEDVGLWQVHVHTDTPEHTLSTAGSMRQVGVRHLRRPDGTDAPMGVVACTRAPGLLAPLARTGAVVVLDADAAGVRRAVEDLGTADVVVLPCDESSARAAAERGGGAPHRTAPRVHVASSSDDVHVLAMAAELGAGAPGGLPEPAAALRRVEQLRTSTRTGAVVPGPDGLQPRAVADALAGVLREAPELLTVVVGDGVEAGIVDLVRRTATEAGVELVLLDGGQRSPALMMGAE